MKLDCETISAKVNVAMLEKADRLFRNDDDGIWIELLQNARRAGAAAVDISVKEVQATSGQCEITIRDDGGGIDEASMEGCITRTERTALNVRVYDRLLRLVPRARMDTGAEKRKTSPEAVPKWKG